MQQNAQNVASVQKARQHLNTGFYEFLSSLTSLMTVLVFKTNKEQEKRIVKQIVGERVENIA